MRVSRAVALFLVTLTIAPAIHAGSTKIAILPVENLAGISDAQLGYLHDVIREAAADVVGAKGYSLVPQDQVAAALQTDPQRLMHCDESCAAFVGKSLGARYVVHATIKHLDREAVVIIKLLETNDGSLKRMQRIKGSNLTELEQPVEQAVGIVLDLEEIVPAPHAVDGLSEIPLEDDSYWGDLLIIATGVKKHGEDRTPRSIKADVYLNGKRVGRTPYRDGLPEGRYSVTIKYGAAPPFSKIIPIVPGRRHRVEAELTIPMTAAEKAAYQQQQREQERARKQALREAFEKEHSSWEEEAIPLRKKRIPMLISGVALSVIGTGFLIGGGVAEAKAQDQHDKVNENHDYWQTAVTPEDREYYAGQIEKYEDWRDRNHILGITYLCIGSASFVTGATLLIYLLATPRVPEEPEPPPGLTIGGGPSVRLAPVLGSAASGLTLNVSF